MRALRTRRLLSSVALGLGVAAVLAVATIVSRVFIERPRPHSSDLVATGRSILGGTKKDAIPLFRVAAIEGKVETLYREQWSFVTAGDYLSLQSVLRTPAKARVLIRRGDTEIDVRENVEIRLEELADRTARFNLLHGKISTEVKNEREKLQIAAGDSNTENSGPAHFVVSAGARGRVDVAATAGQILFKAHGREVLVTAGQESHATDTAPPTEPQPIPDELLLSVFWPEAGVVGDPSTLRGRARPSTSIKVNGARVPVADDGRFAAPVPLKAGDNHVSVEAEDLAGHRKTETTVIRREPRAPALETDRQDLWKR